MDAEGIRTWRPMTFAEVIGEKNRPLVKRTERALARGRMYSKALFVAPFGCGKSSLVELIMKSINCKNRDSSTGDPCHTCTWCKAFGPHNNGYGHPYRRFVVDCTRMNRAEVVEFVGDNYYYEDMAVFFDELHHLHEKHSQEPLLKFVEQFPGPLFAAVMEHKLNDIIEPLQERFEILRLHRPANREITDFFVQKSEEWEIEAPRTLLEEMVAGTEGSFRKCLKIMAAAAENDGKLDQSVLELYLPGGVASPATHATSGDVKQWVLGQQVPPSFGQF